MKLFTYNAAKKHLREPDIAIYCNILEDIAIYNNIQQYIDPNLNIQQLRDLTN